MGLTIGGGRFNVEGGLMGMPLEVLAASDPKEKAEPPKKANKIINTMS